MIRPKPHISDVYRTPHSKLERIKFLRLDKNEDPIGLPQEVIGEILADVTSSFVSAYPQLYQLYEGLSDWLGISDEHLLVTSGSDAAIKTAFEVFVDPEDGVVIPYPTFAMFEVYAKLFRAELTKISYDENLSLPMNELLEAVNTRTKLVCLPNPNSPTGTTVTREDIEDLLNRAAEVGAAVLMDEAYYPFYGETAIGMIDDHTNLIVTRTFSKAMRLASMRLGFAAAHPDTLKLLRAFKPMYEVNGFAVLFGCAILRRIELMDEFVKEVRDGRAYVEESMEKVGLKTYDGHANFILVEVGAENVRPIMERMEKAGILIGGGFDHETLRKCIRISLGPPEHMKTVVDELAGYFEVAWA